ncbi:Bulb-type lectin domain [Macleaya cordata]|uniref:Bulb-type lectin domain n=1 Tax=Macleaya cordata TaxID=56857 RepID=A0A200Q3C9_MACCD|nr:Bulb-type lectin domain [Macleaya cordata]
MGLGRHLQVLLMITTTLTMWSAMFACTEASNTIFTGGRLSSGQYLYNEPYKFIMQSDCNLVLYKNGAARWNSGTNGRGADCYVVLQNDGNLVILSGQGGVIWASQSNRGLNTYRLVLQTDGNVVIYGGAIWATGTN